MQDFELVPLETVVPFFQNWLTVLQRREVGTVFFLPHADFLFRIKQFMAWLKTNHHPEPKIIDFDLDLVQDPRHLTELLTEVKDQNVIVMARRGFVNPFSAKWQAAIETFRVEKSLGILVLHEAAPIEINDLYQHNSFTLNQTIYPLYSPEQAMLFCNLQARDWQLKIKTQDLVVLCQFCGGLLWLVRDVLRQIRDDNNLTIETCFKSENFSWRTQQFWQDLPQEYRSALLNPAVAPAKIMAELVKFNLIQKQPHLSNYSTWPFLEAQIAESQQTAFICQPTKISFFDQDFTHEFSKAERRILAEFWSHPNQIISREKLAECFWSEAAEEKYSDWALDQVIRRIRAKIAATKLPITITTKRGQGYVATI